MVALSLSETGALATKAARGAGYSWGISQEAGFAAKWLTAKGCCGLTHLAALLSAVDGTGPSAHAPHLDGLRLTGTEHGTCGLTLGCLISDMPQLVLCDNSTDLQGIIEPIFLAAYLAQVVPMGKAMALDFSKNSLRIGASSLELPRSLRPSSKPADVELQIIPQLTVEDGPLCPERRLTVDPVILGRLEALAARTYVPESDVSRARGAGGAD